jgi:hypothetical protein
MSLLRDILLSMLEQSKLEQKTEEVKDQRYVQKIEAECAFLKQQLATYKSRFDWSVLWQDEQPSKIDLWQICAIVLQVIVLVVLIMKK